MPRYIWNSWMGSYITLLASEAFWRCNYIRLNESRWRARGSYWSKVREHDKSRAAMVAHARVRPRLPVFQPEIRNEL